MKQLHYLSLKRLAKDKENEGPKAFNASARKLYKNKTIQKILDRYKVEKLTIPEVITFRFLLLVMFWFVVFIRIRSSIFPKVTLFGLLEITWRSSRSKFTAEATTSGKVTLLS